MSTANKAALQSSGSGIANLKDVNQIGNDGDDDYEDDYTEDEFEQSADKVIPAQESIIN